MFQALIHKVSVDSLLLGPPFASSPDGREVWPKKRRKQSTELEGLSTLTLWMSALKHARSSG